MERLGQQPEKQPINETENLSLGQKIKALGSKGLEAFFDNNPWRYEYLHLMDTTKREKVLEPLYSREIDDEDEDESHIIRGEE